MNTGISVGVICCQAYVMMRTDLPLPPREAPAAVTRERFVGHLYAALAWDATISIGDPAVAGRLVERVLRRVWGDRVRFASTEALFLQARDEVRLAIQSESERRQRVTSFDHMDGPQLAAPNGLEAMSVGALSRRLAELRKDRHSASAELSDDLADGASGALRFVSPESFVERLYPELAWEATIALGDPTLASRVVERALHLVWGERARFASADALYLQARDVAKRSISSESERRRNVLRFDRAEDVGPFLPGSLDALNVSSVDGRLGGREDVAVVPSADARLLVSAAPPTRAPAPAPIPAVASSLAPAVPVAAPAAAPVAAPVAASMAPHTPAPAALTPADSATADSPFGSQALANTAMYAVPSATAHDAPPTVPSARPTPPTVPSARPTPPTVPSARPTPPTVPSATTQGLEPRRMPGNGTTPPAAAPARRMISGAKAAATATPKRGRRSLHFGDRIKEAEAPQLPLRALAPFAAGAVVIVLVAWVTLAQPSGESRALVALAGSLGDAKATQPGQRATVTLVDGSTVRLGSTASIQASTSFADAERALVVTGPVSVSLKTDEERPVAISTGLHKWVTTGAVVTFDQSGDRSLMLVDSGAVELLRDDERARYEAGNAVSVDAAGVATPLEAAVRDQSFSWRQGRLRVNDLTLLELRGRLQQWYNVNLTFGEGRAPSTTVSLDVPLDEVDSLRVALEQAVGGDVVRAGRQLEVGGPRPPEPAPSAARTRLQRSTARNR